MGTTRPQQEFDSYWSACTWRTKLGRSGEVIMPPEKSYHMTPEQFRQHGRAVVDWIADYYERIETLPVLSQVEPGQIRQALPADAPAEGEPFAAVLQDISLSLIHISEPTRP